jgi:ABC-2 type transport system ATP-binding protein
VVQLEGVTKWFGETTALDGVDLTVEAGTVHGLLGPNGAGKTTLLSALFGLVLPDEGSVRLFGRTRAEAGPAWLEGIGGFIETPRFYPYLTGSRNLDLLAALDGGAGAAPVAELLELVGLAGAGHRKVRGYSLGMRQRLGLAASLLRRPRLLILDEPTNGMDPAGMRELRSALKALSVRGLTVILASHDMKEVEQICDKVTMLAHGRVLFAGSLDRMRLDAPDPAWQIRTSDDDTALELARQTDEIKATVVDTGGLNVVGAQPDLDDFVISLGRAGVAVRSLTLDVTPLESLFFQLTEEASA